VFESSIFISELLASAEARRVKFHSAELDDMGNKAEKESKRQERKKKAR